jgi:DNA polymerase elongation subunit (family B)
MMLCHPIYLKCRCNQYLKDRSLFPHVSAAIQLSNEDKYPSKGDTIKYIYTNSQHNNPLGRVVPVESTYEHEDRRLNYDKEKYKEMIVDAVESVLGYLVLTGLSMETRKM